MVDDHKTVKRCDVEAFLEQFVPPKDGLTWVSVTVRAVYPRGAHADNAYTSRGSESRRNSSRKRSHEQQRTWLLSPPRLVRQHCGPLTP